MPRQILVVLSVFILCLVVPAQGGGDWHVLFDGKSLDGWRANENAQSFKLDDGKLIVKGPRSHLFYEGLVAGGQFENFILEAEIQTKAKANSGLFFHTRFQKTGWPSSGYEAQVNTTHGDPIKTASLYGVKNVKKAASQDGKWFTLRVEVRQKNVTIRVNGKVLVDYDEPSNVGGTRKLSKGTFAIQAHDPGSEVWYRKIRVKMLPSVRPGMSRAELQTLKRPDAKWWDRMDYGPFLSSSVGISRRGRHVALKGITVPIGPNEAASATFDTDLLRMAVGWDGKLIKNGVTYNGSHGGHPYVNGPDVFHTRALPGWGYRGDLSDPREIPHGPIADARGRYRGLYRHGNHVVFAYDVDGVRVHEMPEWIDGSIVRNIDIAKTAREQILVVADAENNETFEILDGGRVAVMRKGKGKRNPLTVALAGGHGDVRLAAIETAVGKRLIAKIPAAPTSTAFRIAHSRLLDGGFAGFAKDLGRGPDLAAYTKGGPSLYPERIKVKGKLATDGNKPWVVDDVPIPFNNPWDSYMRIGGLDLFSDGTTAAVSTWNGDVWVVSGLDDDLDEVIWRRYATGLFETLGLRIVDDVIYVNGKDQITRLHDLDRDGEADFYECFNNDVTTTRNFHEFTFDLQTDAEGNFYIAKGAPVRGGGRGFEKIVPHHGTVMKIAKDGSNLEIYSRGMRAPNGIGVGPDGQVTCGDNEGTWVPRCKLHWLQRGSFQGVKDVSGTKEPPTDYNKPLCWFPMGVDNSGGGQVWVPKNDRWGPYGGDMLHFSYGKSSIYKVMMETVDGQIQGGVFRIPVKLGSSAMRGRFSGKDGQLWVVGLRGWQTNAARLSALQRVRRTKAPVNLPEALRVTDKGVYLTFTGDLDPELANDVESYSAEWWNYVWSRQYGSPEVSADNPDEKIVAKAQDTELKGHRKHDKVVIKSATLQSDKRTVFLEIPTIKPVMQMHLKMDLESADGREINLEVWNTINKLGRDTGN